MDYDDMESKGTIDYFLILSPYIHELIKAKYPLNKEDLRSIIEDKLTENVINMQSARDILNKELENILKEIEGMNDEIIERAKKKEYVEYSTEDTNKDISKYKQRLDKLLEEVLKQQQGKKILEEIVEMGDGENITTHEINEINKEIKNIEIKYRNPQENTYEKKGVDREE